MLLATSLDKQVFDVQNALRANPGQFVGTLG